MKNTKFLFVLCLLIGLLGVGCSNGEVLTEEGDINLAGCKVPAGITQSQAEGVKCPEPVNAVSSEKD